MKLQGSWEKNRTFDFCDNFQSISYNQVILQLPQQSDKQSTTPLQIFFQNKKIPSNLLLYLSWFVQSKWSIEIITYEFDVVFMFLQPGDVAYTKGKHKCQTLSLCQIEITTINSKFKCMPSMQNLLNSFEFQAPTFCRGFFSIHQNQYCTDLQFSCYIQHNNVIT